MLAYRRDRGPHRRQPELRTGMDVEHKDPNPIAVRLLFEQPHRLNGVHKPQLARLGANLCYEGLI